MFKKKCEVPSEKQTLLSALSQRERVNASCDFIKSLTFSFIFQETEIVSKQKTRDELIFSRF
jgi:hypothetical protein